MNQTIVEAVLAHGQETPDKLAVAFKNVQLSYAELCVQLRKAVKCLQEQYGVQKGDLVMLTAVSKPEYIVLLLGIQYLGAVSVPLDKSAKESNILDVYDFIQPKLLITDTYMAAQRPGTVSLKGLYAELLAGEETSVPYQLPEKKDLAEILFTTGTTGKPKGGMLTYGCLLASTHNTWHGVGMEPEDTLLLSLPLNHSLGMRELRTALYIGATVVLQNGLTFAKELEKNITQYHCTCFVSVPANIEMLYRQMQEQFVNVLGQLRYIEFGAGSLGYDMKKKLTRLLPNTEIFNVWGSTETGGAIFLNVTRHPDKLTSLGKPAEGVELKVLDPEGRAIDAHDIDTAGRMALKGEMEMAGYYHMPEQTAQTLVDGWLLTNDMVYTDSDGYVYMLGRADDIINVGGEKVSPIEVENIAQEYEHIRECACIGVPDPQGILGQVPVLYVVPEGGAFDEKELTKYLSTRMERYKLPQKCLLIGELPRNRMKKLDRKALHRLWESQGADNLTNEVILALRNRRSLRDFTDQPVPRAVLETIVQTGIYAPSGHNMQTWRFTVIQDEKKILHLKEVTARVAKEKKVHFYGFNKPTVLILVSNDRRNANTIQDSACAAQNMMLAAHSLGVGSVWINALSTICDEPEIRSLLQEYDIPDTHIVWATLAMGYPANKGKLLAKKQSAIHWLEP